MRNKLVRELFPDMPRPRQPSQVGPRLGDDMCDDCQRDAATICTHPTLHPFAMYVVSDDPLRDTPDKAEAYYAHVFEALERQRNERANKADIEAVAELLNA